jgi:hypothetical protein
MPRTLTPAEQLAAHVRAFCGARHMPLIVVPPNTRDEEMTFKVCGHAVTFSAAEISKADANLVELVAARIKAVMP